jgi:hypothetical protein
MMQNYHAWFYEETHKGNTTELISIGIFLLKLPVWEAIARNKVLT